MRRKRRELLVFPVPRGWRSRYGAAPSSRAPQRPSEQRCFKTRRIWPPWPRHSPARRTIECCADWCRKSRRAPVAGQETKTGILLDTETTGLDHAKDEIIELGMVKFDYTADGRIVGVRDIVLRLQ